MNTSVHLQDHTWEEVKEKIENGVKTIIIPVGSTEQHGPHLPLGTDTMVAIALAESAAAETGILVAPPMWFGWSPHHMVLPGTVTVRAEILIELACDVMESLIRHGFQKIILLNGHRIVNVIWLQIAGERIKRTTGARVIIFDPAYMSKEFKSHCDIPAVAEWGDVGHAEEIEGSHMWHYYPDLVKMDRAVDNPHGVKPLYSVDPSYAGDTMCYVPSSVYEMKASAEKAGGTVGSPSKSSRDGGKAYHEYVTKRLVEVIGMI